MSSPTNSFNEKLDAIFDEYIDKAGWARLLSTKPENHRDEETLKQAIRDLILREIVGEDDEPRNTIEHSRRNFLRAEQRNKILREG